MRRLWVLFPVLAVGITAGALFLWWNTASAVQAPEIRLDMDPAGNTYSDPGGGGNNSMTVGAIDNCLTSATANAATHAHPTHLIIQNVEDIVGFQVRLNYIGDKMRPSNFNPSPFADTLNGGNVGFLNLPLDTGAHRIVTPTAAIPTAPPDNTNTAQTALVGGAYQGLQTFPGSPDTPAKPTPDDNTYSAPNGGILGTLTLQVIGNESGNSLDMDLDDGIPNAPGSRAVVFNGSAATNIDLAEAALGDGFHGEGTACVLQVASPTASPTESPSPTPSPTPAPTATPGPTLGPGQTPTRTPTPGAGGTGGAAGTPTRAATPRVSPAALPPTGANDDGGTSNIAYLLIFAGGALPIVGVAYKILRLRRR